MTQGTQMTPETQATQGTQECLTQYNLGRLCLLGTLFRYKT